MLSSGSRDRFILQRDVRTPRFKMIRLEVFLLTSLYLSSVRAANEACPVAICHEGRAQQDVLACFK